VYGFVHERVCIVQHFTHKRVCGCVQSKCVGVGARNRVQRPNHCTAKSECVCGDGCKCARESAKCIIFE